MRKQRKGKMMYEYEPHGMTGGETTNIQEDYCRICGDAIVQPLPTGIWLHADYDENDFVDKADHLPKPASILEQLLIENAGRWSSYKKECPLHRKYWLNFASLSKKEIKEMIGDENEWNREHWGNDVYTRKNSMALSEFINSDKKFLAGQPKDPEYYIVIKMRHGRGRFGANAIKYETVDEIPWTAPDYYPFYRSSGMVQWKKKLFVSDGDVSLIKISKTRSVYYIHLRNATGYEKCKLEKGDMQIIFGLII